MKKTIIALLDIILAAALGVSLAEETDLLAQIQERGTMQECVRWCENVLKANGGEITIAIRDTGEMEFDDKE